jgi:hypothetical protein
VNDDLLPGHESIHATMASARQEHIQRLATVLDLDSGLAAILTPDRDADRNELAATSRPGTPVAPRPRPPLPSGPTVATTAVDAPDRSSGFQHELLAIRQDPQIKAVALRRAGDPDLAEDALQNAYCAAARVDHPESIKDLRAYFVHVLVREVYRLRTQLELLNPAETRQHGAPADSRSSPQPVAETVAASLLACAWFKRLATQRDHLCASVPARSGDPARYRIMIVTVAEQVLRDALHGEPSEADSEDAFRAAYPEWFSEPGCAKNTCHQRFRRARADVKALLQAIVSRDELQP